MPNLDPVWQPWIYTLTFMVGACFGSFFNLMAYRFLTEQSIISPASFCPHTQTPLQWYENIPLVSYLIQGGKSRYSGKPIGLEYPLSELFTGLLFVGVVWIAGLTWQTLLLLFLVGNLVVITLTDLKESLIFHVNSLSLIPVGLIYNGFDLGQTSADVYSMSVFGLTLPIPESFLSALIGIAVAFAFFEGLIWLSNTVFGTEGFGHGDTHLMMGVGAFLGWKLVLLALMLGFIFQGIPAIPVMVYQWFKRKDYISIGAGTAMLVFGLLPMALTYWPIDNLTTRALLVLACFVLALVAMGVFLKRAKDNQSFTYLPLGPALVLGSLVTLFWGPELLMSYFN